MPSLDSLTPDKYQDIILGLTAERTIVVKGVAGSGKSLTLLKKAKQVSTFSQSYAIIVYTKSLKQFFVDELAEIGQTQGIVHTKSDYFTGAYVVPFGKGEYEAKITLMCAEYQDPEETKIKLVVE